jgi:hypothetical protein
MTAVRSFARRGAQPDASLLARFIPEPNVRERFETTILAPAEVVMDVAGNFDMQSLLPVKAIFRLREKLTGAAPVARQPQGILAETRALGWGVLDEQPGRYVICGARCQPWLPDVTFTPIAADRFVAYADSDQVKIAWTLEAQPLDQNTTRFAQETRAVATDAQALRKFRRYWRWARFGIIAIRLLMLPAVRRAAERRWRAQRGFG